MNVTCAACPVPYNSSGSGTSYSDWGAFEYDADVPYVACKTPSVTVYLSNGSAVLDSATVDDGSSDGEGALVPATLTKENFDCHGPLHHRARRDPSAPR